MPDDLSHRCHTEPFFGIACPVESSHVTAGLVERLQRVGVERRMVRPAGFEPATLGLAGPASEGSRISPWHSIGYHKAVIA